MLIAIAKTVTTIVRTRIKATKGKTIAPTKKKITITRGITARAIRN